VTSATVGVQQTGWFSGHRHDADKANSPLPPGFETYGQAPALLQQAELIFARQPPNAHEQEALREGRLLLEVAQSRRAMLLEIPPDLARCLTNVPVHACLLP